MKQKLLNLFTWRATLLVALLCTSFGNAWGQETETLTFTASNGSLSQTSPNTNEGITWSGSTELTGQTTSTTLTSSSITGIVKEVIVNSKVGNTNTTYTIKVEAGELTQTISDLTNKNPQDNVFGSSSSNYYVNGEIKVTITRNNTKKDVTVNYIKVTYVSKATIPAPGALDKDANPAKYYGTYSNKCQFVVHEGLTVSTVSVAGGVLTVTDYNYDQDNPKIIPANTGVMISASNNTATYTVDLKLATVPAIDGNMLRPTGDNGITATAMGNADSGCLFYYLTINSENDQIGFYRRNDTGAAFDMNTDAAKNKAYLAVPSGQVGNVKGYTFGDGTNSIKAVETEKAESNAIYNLAGQRVSKMQKGIYVVNGKKVLVK